MLAIIQRFEQAVALLPDAEPPPMPAAEKDRIKEASPEQHEEIGKCPACKETTNGLNHVCPSCGLVIDANHDTHSSPEQMLELDREASHYQQLKLSTADQQTKTIVTKTDVDLLNLTENARRQPQETALQAEARNSTMHQLDLQSALRAA
jgi:transcription initiation factor TFIIIB Brf1 subunit/transcription initiation factor TFIIB